VRGSLAPTNQFPENKKQSEKIKNTKIKKKINIPANQSPPQTPLICTLALTRV
jgi:hypothetical protein